MKDGEHPTPNTIHPIAGYDKEIYVKPTITNPNIIVGDFTYIADQDFESHVSHLYEWNDDKLIIGKFCQIAAGVEFVMNGANHQMNAVSTFPFYTLEGWEMSPPAKTDLPLKGYPRSDSPVETIETIIDVVQLPENEDYPGEDVVEIINLQGETTTVYKLVDGRYMDCTNTVYIYDGKDTWTDTNGVEWNQEVIQFCQFCQNQKTGC